MIILILIKILKTAVKIKKKMKIIKERISLEKQAKYKEKIILKYYMIILIPK